jgi:hypothetical protein
VNVRRDFAISDLLDKSLHPYLAVHQSWGTSCDAVALFVEPGREVNGQCTLADPAFRVRDDDNHALDGSAVSTGWQVIYQACQLS